MSRSFLNRRAAGAALAGRLLQYAGRPDVVVLALPRGGVPVGFEVARALGAPLDVFVVRKLGAPQDEEVAIGAVASGGGQVVDRDLMNALGLDDDDVAHIAAEERAELVRREDLYRGGRPFPSLVGRTVIVVDDGLATGASMRVALAALRSLHPGRLVAAVPVASREACAAISAVADLCICVATPEPFRGVGMWYRDFTQVTDGEVLALLEPSRSQLSLATSGRNREST